MHACIVSFVSARWALSAQARKTLRVANLSANNAGVQVSACALLEVSRIIHRLFQSPT
jgi:hypothetical protein